MTLGHIPMILTLLQEFRIRCGGLQHFCRHRIEYLVGCTGTLNGVGRKRACRTDCIAISGDLKKMRKTGRRMMYLRTKYQNVSRCNANKTHRAIPKRVERMVKSALKRAEMVSALLMPGHALTASMFEFCTSELVLTTGTEDEPSSDLGVCVAGSACRIRWRCRVKVMLRRERTPYLWQIACSVRATTIQMTMWT